MAVFVVIIRKRSFYCRLMFCSLLGLHTKCNVKDAINQLRNKRLQFFQLPILSHFNLEANFKL